jgi:hypothetical protein
LVFNPLVVLGISIAAALVLGVAVSRTDWDDRDFVLYYFVPITVPFVAFYFDRAQSWSGLRRWQLAIDVSALATAILRVYLAIPLVSGHSLFLTYALLTTRTWLALVTSVVVLSQVLFTKIFLWQDPTWAGGMLLGLIAAILFRSIGITRMSNRVRH